MGDQAEVNLMDGNSSITLALAYVAKAQQDLQFNGDLVQLKFCLKQIRARVDQAHTMVDNEINNARRSKRMIIHRDD